MPKALNYVCPPVNSRYGAPMGCHGAGVLITDTDKSVRLFEVPLDSGGYDIGGAYWGHQQGHRLYAALDCGDYSQFVRARSRRAAAAELGIPESALVRGFNK